MKFAMVRKVKKGNVAQGNADQRGRAAIRIATVIGMAVYAGLAFSGTDDPMGDGMCYFVNMLTGKWVFGASVICFVGVALTFIKGVEMNDFVSKVASAVAVVSFLLAAAKMVKVFAGLFGTTAVC